MDVEGERETSRANDMLVWITVAEKMSAQHTAGSQLGKCLLAGRICEWLNGWLTLHLLALPGNAISDVEHRLEAKARADSMQGFKLKCRLQNSQHARLQRKAIALLFGNA